MIKRRLYPLFSTLILGLAFGSTQALAEKSPPPDCVPQAALDAYVQRSIERKADIYASLSPDPGTTLFLGSSIIEEGPWNAIFPSLPVLNWGISAETTDDMMNRLDSVIDAKPANIILYIGGNDLSRQGRTPDQALEGVKHVISRLKDGLPETNIYLNTLFPRETRHAQSIVDVNNGLRTLARTSDIDLIDGYPFFLGDEGAINPTFSNDGIHLSGEAYHIWSDLISEALAR